ncbi:hypothetical protein V6Z11_D01G083200 [Gossypium hirsutum]
MPKPCPRHGLTWDSVDRVSDLPDSILTHILSFLPTKEAVGTSILSTRWRYLFALLSNLDRVLFFHNTSVDKFRLKCGKTVDSRRVCGWISAALWRVLFTCSTLITLKLDIGFLLDVPKGIIFPNLKTLHLRSVVFFGDDSVESLIYSCTSLEDMVIEKCHMWNITNFNISYHLLRRLTILYSEFIVFDFWLIIDAPNLAYFKYIDHVVARYSLENLQTLIKADIGIFNNSKVHCLEGSLMFAHLLCHLVL